MVDIKKAHLISLGFIGICVALLVAGTLSYTTTTQSAQIQLSTGFVKINLEQTGQDAYLSEDGFSKDIRDSISLFPGQTLKQTATLQNTGEHPVWVRIKLDLSIENTHLDADDLIVLDGISSSWVNQDGFWYYTQALDPYQSTEPLFEQVHLIDDPLVQSYKDKTIVLSINALSVQSQNNSESPFSASGWQTP